MKTIKSKWVYNTILVVIPIIYIVYVSSYRLGEQLYPAVYGDEFGYWAAGSFLSNLHWEDISSINPYYNYGYGIFLCFILRIFDDPIHAYKAALWMNVAALGISYVIIRAIIREIVSLAEYRIHILVQTLCAIVVTCFPAYLQYVNYTMAEIPTMLFTWLGLLSIVKICKTNKFIYNILALFLASCMVAIHMRNIGFLSAVIVFLGFKSVADKKEKRVPLILLISFIAMVVFLAFKNIYGSHYLHSTIFKNNNNEIGGIINKINYTTTYDGMKKLSVALVGKAYYVLVASYGLAIIPFAVLFKVIYKGEKKEKPNAFEQFVLFCIVLCAGMVLIDGIYMIDIETRFDLLVYGRYIENTIPPLMILGMLILLNDLSNISNHYLLGSYAGSLLISQITEKYQDYSLTTSNVFINMTPLAAFFIRDGYVEGTYIRVTSWILICFTIVILISAFQKNEQVRNGIFLILAIIVIGLEVKVAHYVLDNGFFCWAVNENMSDLELYHVIEERNIQDQLYYYPDVSSLMADGMQFLLKDYSIHVTQRLSGKESYILLSSKSEEAWSLEALGYEQIGESIRLQLWEKKGS